MTDRHLNLFYSYNKSENAELIENNLTRAFIQTLRALSGRVRNSLLYTLDERLREHDFSGANFALQGHIDGPDCDCREKYIVTIATRTMNTDVDDQTEYETYGSIPDAWVFDNAAHSYCLLIENKRGGNPLDQQQILSHAKNYFGLDTDESRQRTVPLVWLDVLRAVEEAIAQEPPPNEQERYVLDCLGEFLGFFDYRRFKGFRFDGIESCSVWRLSAPTRRGLFLVDELLDVPNFRLFRVAAMAATMNASLRFDQLRTPPTFRLFVGIGDKDGH